MAANGIIGIQAWAAKPGRSLAWLLLLLFCLSHHAWGAGAVEVRRLGLSKVAEDTLLTVILSQAAIPRVSSREVSGKPQLVVDFPGARAGHLPRHLEGDELLVQQVLTETAAPGGGVRIILDLFPEKPFTYWKMNRPGAGGQTMFMLGLKADPKARPVQARVVPSTEPEPVPTATPREELPETETMPDPSPPGEDEGGYQEPKGNVAPGSFAELRRLMPKAAQLLQGLETEGWVVSESNRYDRPGRRLSRDFMLNNHKYPELVVKIAYLPANVPNTPNIDIIMLSTENLTGEDATKYRGLRQWSFAKIKGKYEDIGDFFDDALKPLRVKLREQTKSVALKDAAVFQNFLKLACPTNPQVADQVMQHVRAKVSPRFEGVQFTVSENPLIILNLVDFLYVKVYYLETPGGGGQ
ncbi:MAG: hypothetical protein L6277_18330 [Desulfobacterales bacterium]|nr:hypothetical protein [Pseudomonadota bacterium]MBU4356349.1 hypothetical protein [Pseudomonadota bacterium]MCG2774029.1 hypothetical protein [Desulfobacterales bacterium]